MCAARKLARRTVRRPKLPDEPWLPGWSRLLLGLGIVPAAVGLARALWVSAIDLQVSAKIMSLDRGVFAFVVAFCFFCLAFVFLPRPTRTYIWIHELTHVIFARLQGARYRNFKVSAAGGSVQLSRTSLLTLLAPYFFPLQSVLLTLILLALSRFVAETYLRTPGMALLGLAWGFHFCFTIGSLSQHQTDIERSGYVFGYAWIIFLNLVLLAGGFLAVHSFLFLPFLVLWHDFTFQAYGAVWDTVFEWSEAAITWIRNLFV